MIGSLTGIVTARLEQRVLIDVHGVGYWVFTGSWQPEGETVCYIHHHVREDINVLYGFASLGGLQLFEQLITVSGVGPKAALAVLSLDSASRVCQAIAKGDASFLSMAPGVGKKAAEKIILELQNKLSQWSSEEISTEVSAASDELIEALESLGYRAADFRSLVGKVPEELADLQSRLKWILRQL